MNFYEKVMNMQPMRSHDTGAIIDWSVSYDGYQDARNTASKIAQEADDEIKQLRIQVKQADERGDEAMRQKHYLEDIVRWSYERLQPFANSTLYDRMMYDRMELWAHREIMVG